MAEKDSDESGEANKENTMHDASWPGPRSVTVPRVDGGFGFTLRHFIVYPPESTIQAEYEDEDGEGQITGEGAKRKRSKLSGLDPMDTIFVKQVKEGGAAYQAGLQKGDRIVSVNGESVTGKSYSQVIALIQGSDSALQLLVVPKDEDILQMAYESSAYNQGMEPHRGSAQEIPQPPPVPTQPASGRGGPSKPPSGPGRFRSELHVLSEDEHLQRKSRRDDKSEERLYADALRAQQFDPRFVLPGQRMSTSSIGSVSSSGSYGSGKDPLTTVGEGSDSASTNLTLSPAPPLRTSSKNITLSQLGSQGGKGPAGGGPHSGSLESISRSSDSSGSRPLSQDASRAQQVSAPGQYGSQERLLRTSNEKAVRRLQENHHHSSDDLMGHGTRIPGAPTEGTRRTLPSYPPPYTRAQTNPTLLHSSSPKHTQELEVRLSPASYSQPPQRDLQPSQREAQSQPTLWKAPSPTPHKVCSRKPLSESYQNVGSSQDSIGASQDSVGGVKVAACDYVGGPRESASLPDPRRHGQGDSYGLRVSYKRSEDRERRSQPPTARHSVPERPMINLVTERMRKFESADAVDTVPTVPSGGSWRHHAQISRLGYNKAPKPHSVGYDSVASRTAQFQQWMECAESSSEDLSSARESPVPQSCPPLDIRKVPATPPATINFYFRGETPTESITLEPSPERSMGPPTGPMPREPSPQTQPQEASHSEQGQEESADSKSHKPALRQASYLTAINSPNNQSGSRPSPPRLDPAAMTTATSSVSHPMPHPTIAKGLLPGSVRSTQNAKVKPPSGSSTMRSGLMSAFNMMAVPVMNAETMPPSSSSITTGTTTSTTTSNVRLRQQQTADEREQKVKRRTSYLIATEKHHLTINTDRQDTLLPSPAASPSMGHQSETRPMSDLTIPTINIRANTPDRGSPSPQSPTLLSPPGGEAVTPTKTSNIKKLKAFFGERTPRILEATTESKSQFDLPSPMGEVALEGALHCKLAVTDGKRANDRSWKPVWAVLRGHAMYLHKDKSNVSPTSCDEQPISVKSSIVDIAYDYTKKKNVFRLTTFNGSEYLFQADDRDVMLQWISSIQNHNDPDQDKESTQSTDLIIRKTVEQTSKCSPQPPLKDKDKKKTSTRSLRSKSPAYHSPASKPKKQYGDNYDSPKPKDSKTWKGKMAKKFKRYGSSSSQSVDQEPSVEMVEGTFGVPLELCAPCSFSEFIPLVVELCTNIVEARGLENQGLYRVPGNTSAVNMLQGELDRDPEAVDTDNEKWLDVNVVSSLLKSFFRKLPDPLITDDLYESIITANRTEHPEKRMLKIKKILHDLPEHNFETFKYLAMHLSRVAAKDYINKMDARNLAIVFGPTLVRPHEDSMVTMVRDMSDQCRIVESIISHPQWFFSSWDEDVNVPIDELQEGAQPVSGMNRELLVKAENLELGERGRDTSAKVLVSSIISAANKKVKMRKKEKTKTFGSIDLGIESEPSSYNERNIDAEIELRQMRQQMSHVGISKDNSSSSISTASSLQQMSTLTIQETVKSGSSSMTNLAEKHEGVYTAKMVYVRRKDSDSSLATGSTGESEGKKREVVPADVKRYPAYPAPDLDALNISTDNSKSSMVHRFSQENLADKHSQHDEVNHKRGGLTYQAQQHLKRLEIETRALRQKEEVRAAEQQRLAHSRQLIEMELQKTQAEMEADEAEDLLPQSSRSRGAKVELGVKFSQSGGVENTSVTSDYSTNSSANLTFDGKPSAPVASSTPSRIGHGYTSDYSSTASPVSLKHHMSPGKHRHGNQGTPPASQINHTLSGQTQQSPNGRKFFVMSSSTPPAVAVQAYDDMALQSLKQSTPRFDTRKVACKGTLKKKRTRRNGPWPTDGSEDVPLGMITMSSSSLGASPLGMGDGMARKGSLDSLLNFHNSSFVESDTSEDLLEEIASADQRFKVLLSPRSHHDPNRMSNYRQPIALSDTSISCPFRDPSLHRVQPRDPKVGIASRFPARKELNNGAQKDTRAMSKPMSTSRAISKSEKTDANLSKQQRLEREEYASSLRKSMERLYGSVPSPTSPVKSPDLPALTLLQQKSKSASPALRKRENKRSQPRRHTVGGTDDMEHAKAMMSLHQGDSRKLSAWDRLRPNVADSQGESRDLQSWLQQQRMKRSGSSPALSEPALSISSSDSSEPKSRARTVTTTPFTSTPSYHNEGVVSPVREYRGIYRPQSPATSLSSSSTSTSQSGSTRGRLLFESSI